MMKTARAGTALLTACAAAIVMVVTIRSDSTAKFSVDGTVTLWSTAVATIQPRTGAPGYSWLRIYFYASPLTADDRARAQEGRIASIETRWTAVLQLTLDKALTVSQVDLALPGHTCTIAESDRDAKNALQVFQLAGKHLRLRGRGSHVCDMKFMGIPNQTFGWDVDLDLPVVEGAH
jgi:hypothetical protein